MQPNSTISTAKYKSEASMSDAAHFNLSTSVTRSDSVEIGMTKMVFEALNARSIFESLRM
jgi:hypothetical protein